MGLFKLFKRKAARPVLTPSEQMKLDADNNQMGIKYKVTELPHQGERSRSGPNNQTTAGYRHSRLKNGERIEVNGLGGFRLTPIS
jgi:hypothetical protein